MSKDRQIVLDVGGDASVDTGGLGSPTMNVEMSLQADVDTHGLESQTGQVLQEQTEGQFHESLEAIPLVFPAGIGRREGVQDDNPFGHASVYESTDISRDEHMTEASSSSDVLGEEACSSPLNGARQADGNSTMGSFSAANMADQEPPNETHEQPLENQEATTPARVPAIVDELEKEDTADFGGIGEDTMAGTPPPPYHQPPAYSTTVPPPQAIASKGKQAEMASDVSASDDHSEAETPSAPRTPSPTRPSEAASGTPATRRTRTRKDKSRAADKISPPATRSAKKKKAAEAAEAAATETGSPPPLKRKIKIILHFNRKSKANKDADVVPEPEAAGGSNPESTDASSEPSSRGGGYFDEPADEPDADADGGADADEEVMLF